MTSPDPRLTPARGDIAAAHLRGVVQAERYVEPADHTVIACCAPIRRAPNADAPMDDQALFGETFAVLEEKHGWGWGFSRADGYVGWADMAALGPAAPPPTHRVVALRTYLYAEPDLKSPPRRLISLNAKLRPGRTEGRFADTGQGWVFAGHIAPLDDHEADFAAVAEQFLGTPYLWGGKESVGLDCSGLLQMALEAAGVSIPRDSDQQEQALSGRWTVIAADAPKRRGDVVFWPGHVGIMLDEAQLLHANAHHMQTAVEPLAEAVARISARGLDVRTVARSG
ncbi:MAG: C40 family peptidase [Maricaulaceae bacterium]|nr:C40 family peptidase [Maricaulaceae bacterium]